MVVTQIASQLGELSRFRVIDRRQAQIRGLVAYSLGQVWVRGEVERWAFLLVEAALEHQQPDDGLAAAGVGLDHDVALVPALGPGIQYSLLHCPQVAVTISLVRQRIEQVAGLVISAIALLLASFPKSNAIVSRLRTTRPWPIPSCEAGSAYRVLVSSWPG
jgi:hypothetical protein